jgi:hypothetical protein
MILRTLAPNDDDRKQERLHVVEVVIAINKSRGRGTIVVVVLL